MRTVVPLAEARDDAVFGSKAAGLEEAVRGGLPLPPGIALAGSVVEEVASGEQEAIIRVAESISGLPVPLAVRSSAVDEDGAQASFAGQHITLLNIRTVEAVSDAVREIWWSATSDSAITYRQRVGLFRRPSVGVVVQSLLDPVVAGVMFTQNPINGADERMIEASWGLGEAVVAAQVIPDSYRVARTGEILERRAGLKKIAIRARPDRGTFEAQVPAELTEKLCLTDGDLGALHALATRCEELYDRARDIEWAIADGELYLLQCRAITRAGN
jgi:phosphoenolpyruvate synthase/pyruvate phosphate dikinase